MKPQPNRAELSWRRVQRAPIGAFHKFGLARAGNQDFHHLRAQSGEKETGKTLRSKIRNSSLRLREREEIGNLQSSGALP
jgi:hypothetical protein